jgi:type II secretory pathway component GspD/PulD (secretin)
MKTIKYFLLFVGLVLSGNPAVAEEVTLNFSDADLVAVINSVSQIRQGPGDGGVIEAIE